MLYKLRFFQQKGITHSDCSECFATARSEHLPKTSEKVFIADSLLKNNTDTGIIYEVVYTVVVYDENTFPEQCTSVEVVVKTTEL